MTLHKGLLRGMHVFNTLLCYSKFTHSRQVSERRKGKRERQVILLLVLLIKVAEHSFGARSC